MQASTMAIRDSEPRPEWRHARFRDSSPELDATVYRKTSTTSPRCRSRSIGKKDIRYVMITHYNDGVVVLRPPLAVQAPEWLADPDAPTPDDTAPDSRCTSTHRQQERRRGGLLGVFAAEGHDYRADLVPFFDAVLGLASDERKTAIVKALETEESRRTRWIKARARSGRAWLRSSSRRFADQIQRRSHRRSCRGAGLRSAEDFQDTDGGVVPSDVGQSESGQRRSANTTSQS